MNFSLYIAKRYLLSKSSSNAINFITIIAAIGVIIGSASLFIVLSGFAGLKHFSLQFTTLVDPDLKAISASGKSFTISEEELIKLNETDAIANYSKIIEERVFINFDKKKRIATIKGVDQNYQNVNDIDSVIYYGNWFKEDLNQIVVGYGISNDLSFGVLDYAKSLTLFVPKPGKGQITGKSFNSINVVNVGIFDINEELNNKYVYANIETVKDLLNYKKNQISTIEFKLKENIDEELVRTQIQEILGDKVVIKNRMQLNDKLYKMLNTENLAVYLIFTLVLIIALFNVIGSIIMMILDKKKSLSTLFNLGATVKEIRRIFFFQGSLMSVVGGLIGLVLGALLVINQLYGPDSLKVMITPSLAYPVSILSINFVIVFFTISVLGIIASKIASTRIRKNLIES